MYRCRIERYPIGCILSHIDITSTGKEKELIKRNTPPEHFFWPFLASPPIWIFLVVLELGPKSKNKY